TAVPVELDLKAFKRSEPDRKLAYALFRELEFTALTREFADSAPLFDGLEGAIVQPEKRYQIITKREDLDKLVRRLWEADFWSFAVDDSNSEKDAGSYEKQEPLGVAISTGAGASVYIDLQNFAEGKEAAVTPLRDILSNGFLEKCVYD
ncbi:MAG: hypothetical protein ABR557_14650, partial [Pyrinomonadaceae bacterium]